MNPLSPLTYTRRHKASAGLLIALVALATLGLTVMVAVLDTIPMRANTSYLTRVSLVVPATGDALDPAVVSQIEANADVARVVADNGLGISPPTLIGLDSLRLMGVHHEDLPYLMEAFGVRLKEGQLPRPRSNEIMISEESARALGLSFGDQIDRGLDERYYATLPTPMRMVGILEGDPESAAGKAVPIVRVGFASYEYLESHESYAPRPVALLVVAREGCKEALDAFLEDAVRSPHTEVQTFREISRLMTMGLGMLRLAFGVVNCLVGLIVALVVGVVNQMALTRRLPEFGLLHALGLRRDRLIGRMTLETAATAAAGWLPGLLLGWLVLAGLKAGPYYDLGMELDLGNLVPLWFTLPIPAVVIIMAWRSARTVFRRFDAVAIIERGQLGAESGRPAGVRAQREDSRLRPLSAGTYYRRHRRRTLALVLSMTLAILGVALPVFILSTLYDAMEPTYAYLRFLSAVSPGAGESVDPAVASQLRNHPAVARVVPAIYQALRVQVPPAGSASVAIYGVPEETLAPLMAHLGMELVTGRLPRPRTNEIVVSQAVALNRGLQLGDTLGGLHDGGDEDLLLGSDDLPAGAELVGLLGPDDLWLGFASLEYLSSHELTASRPVQMLAVPKDKVTLDAWLEESIASETTTVNTHDAMGQLFRESRRDLLILIAAVESIIALVAAIAVAALNSIFYSQRRAEFGILNAIGRGRSWLLLRTAKETTSAIVIAWLLGAALCAAGLALAQAAIYAPRGLTVDYANVTPWLFTIPIPLAVIAVSTGTIGRTLARLDPVSIVEGRT